MKKIFLLSSIALLFTLSASAQKVKKYAKLIYTVQQVENSDVSVSVDNAVANEKMVKFKLTITNKTNDYIIWKPEECKWIANGKEMKCTEKGFTINPLDSDTRVVNLTGEYNSTPNCTFVIEGLYKVSSKGNGIKTPDFKLPVSKYDFATGGFNVSNTKLYKESDGTKATFSVAYTGDKVGCIFPDKATVMMPDNNEYSAVKKTGLFAKSSMVMLTKGKTDEFDVAWDRMEGGKTMDMQKVVMMIKWNDAFCEITPEHLKTVTLNFDINEGASK